MERTIGIDGMTLTVIQGEWSDEGTALVTLRDGRELEGVWRLETSGPETGDATLLYLEVDGLAPQDQNLILERFVQEFAHWGVEAYQPV